MRENRIWRNKMAKIVPAAIGQSAGLLKRKSEAEGYDLNCIKASRSMAGQRVSRMKGTVRITRFAPKCRHWESSPKLFPHLPSPRTAFILRNNKRNDCSTMRCSLYFAPILSVKGSDGRGVGLPPVSSIISFTFRLV
jgi:hypothetical protein